MRIAKKTKGVEPVPENLLWVFERGFKSLPGGKRGVFIGPAIAETLRGIGRDVVDIEHASADASGKVSRKMNQYLIVTDAEYKSYS